MLEFLYVCQCMSMYFCVYMYVGLKKLFRAYVLLLLHVPTLNKIYLT